MRRWRGMRDIKLSKEGRLRALQLGIRVRNDFDAVYHDGLKRCRKTAKAMQPTFMFMQPEAGPWRMGPTFEGQEIDDKSLEIAGILIKNPDVRPPGGETFEEWSSRWHSWIRNLQTGYATVAVVTHNRNIQYLYSIYQGEFYYKLYDVHGPDFCSVHVYDQRTGDIALWNGGDIVPGFVYLVRHADTEWGT